MSSSEPTAAGPAAAPEQPASAAIAATEAAQAALAPGHAAPVAPAPGLGIEAESADINEDDDSAYGDDLESYTTSLKSTVLNHRFENGRRYHGFKEDTNKYVWPNDDLENDRLDLYHHIIYLRLGGELHLAPIGPNPQRVLDLGTGTGIWAIDMGDKYPSAEIVGNDISPIQPSLVPPNVKFEIDDMEDEWVYSSKFDYIHCRYMTCAIKDWKKLMRQTYKFTKPGGYAEFQDFEVAFYTTSGGEYNEDSAISDWMAKAAAGVRKFGAEPDPGPLLEGLMKEAGFVDVFAQVYPIPTGTWPKNKTLKEIGAFDLINYLDNLEGLTMRIFSHAYGWSEEEVKVLCAQLRKEFKNPRMRMQHNFYVAYGRKPENAVD